MWYEIREEDGTIVSSWDDEILALVAQASVYEEEPQYLETLEMPAGRVISRLTMPRPNRAINPGESAGRDAPDQRDPGRSG